MTQPFLAGSSTTADHAAGVNFATVKVAPVTGPGAYQVPATASTTHEMMVAIIIMGAVGMLLVILAGESPKAGNTIAAGLGLLLLVQGITHVNPFVSFLSAHPLTPKGPSQ